MSIYSEFTYTICSIGERDRERVQCRSPLHASVRNIAPDVVCGRHSSVYNPAVRESACKDTRALVRLLPDQPFVNIIYILIPVLAAAVDRSLEIITSLVVYGIVIGGDDFFSGILFLDIIYVCPRGFYDFRDNCPFVKVALLVDSCVVNSQLSCIHSYTQRCGL